MGKHTHVHTYMCSKVKSQRPKLMEGNNTLATNTKTDSLRSSGILKKGWLNSKEKPESILGLALPSTESPFYQPCLGLQGGSHQEGFSKGALKALDSLVTVTSPTKSSHLTGDEPNHKLVALLVLFSLLVTYFDDFHFTHHLQESTILNTTCYATGTFLDGAAASVTPTTALTKYFMHNSIIIPSSGLQLLSKASKNKDNY